MLTVLLLLVALTAVTTTIAVVATNDTISAGRDRQSAAAQATADAGVAQALEYIRQNGVGGLNCSESAYAANNTACNSNPAGWTNPGAPAQFRVDGASGTCAVGSDTNCFRVWIGAVTPYVPPAQRTGRYRIHSTGLSGGGPGAKQVLVDVSATPTQFPIGVYGDRLTGNGGTSIYNEMLFTQDCVSPRYDGHGNGTRFQGTDPYWDEPASANSTTFVSTSNKCGASGYLHQGGNDCPAEPMKYDRSSLGGSVATSSPCAHFPKLDGSQGTRTSTYFDMSILQMTYHFRPGGLSDAEYDALRVRAVSMNTLNRPTSSLLATLNSLVAAGISNPVVYYDNGSSVSLHASDLPASFSRTPDSACTAPKSVVIVVRNGDLVYQGGTSGWRSAAIFVQEGDFQGNGGYNILGTLFAHDLSLGGTEHLQLDSCFVRNIPGGLIDLNVLTFRENDRSDVG